MIFLTVISSILIASVSIIQFRNEAKDYHQERLERKETAIKENINYILKNTTYPLTTENIPLIFSERDKIHEISDIHALEINFYDLNGKLLKSSKSSFAIDDEPKSIPSHIVRLVLSSMDKRYVEVSEINGIKNLSSYSEIKDLQFKPLAILNLPYIEDDGYYERELRKFMIRFGQVYAFMLLLSGVLAYFLSSFITKSIKTISDKLTETQLNKKNEKIELETSSREIGLLVEAYNNMVDELEESAVKLAQGEREQAWREMAKQVAHEVKNPLTPMRLTVQSFQRKFDENDPNIKQKLDDYTKTLLQQIDIMSSVANAFSNFASMPAQQNELINVVEVVSLGLEIFNENYIHFESTEKEIFMLMDRTQLIRIITNLVKNATQAISNENSNPIVLISVSEENSTVKIEVKDNGIGISDENKMYVFEPKFTTKNSGMGLGLGIIKKIIENYNGTITFESEQNKGTTFTVLLPLNTNE
ncbi:ATP-binding protein [Flavobacterium azooxidireducens]|uniref:histidine kinase n=1 Tax=Flavobacterium azooxidireducens TaxID=1871076 RepID=A0ABY4KKZ6_9FLAO|nr:ATP-binding protein [Flavobacterium azooxidireducens]UPQ80348.1 ATP-binding protein [Flavobacterium azooxidireducens]